MCFRLTLIAALTAITLLLAGCTGAREAEEVGYAVAVGLDKSDQPGMVNVSYQLATPQGAGEKDVSSKAEVITITSVSLAEVRNLLTSAIAPTPSLHHLKILILGEEFARQGVMNTIGAAQRHPEFRGSMFVVVAQGTAKDFLENNKPVFEFSPSKHYEVQMGSGAHSGYLLPTSMHEFYIRLKSGSGQPYALLVGTNPKSKTGEERGTKIPGDKTKDYLAGDIPREGGNSIEYLGTAVFNGDKLVGKLTNTETRLLAILLGRLPHSFMTVDDPLMAKKAVNVALRLGSKPKINVEIVDGIPLININIMLEGEISSIASGINYEDPKYLSILEEQYSQIFKKRMSDFIRHTQELNSDVAGFGYFARSRFRTVSEFNEYQWNQKYSQAQINVDVTTRIRRTGLMIRSYPIS